MVAEWQFDKRKLGGVRRGPPEYGQFDNDDTDLPETLVREAIQNSLDAKIEGLDNEPVEVNFRIKKLKKNEIDELTERMDSLRPHVEACGRNYPNDEDVYTLSIEDFNTTGLTGSFKEEDGKNYDNFWRSYGEGENKDKSGTKGGRWGLGKLVYSNSSKLHCFYGMTIREREDKLYAIGQAALENHTYNDTLYDAYGFWFNKHFTDAPDFPSPVSDEDEEEIKFLRNISDAQRTNRSGLSIIIPYLIDRIDKESIISAIIKNYYFPILDGQLIIDVDGIDINSQTFSDRVDEYQKSDGEIPLAFIREISSILKQKNSPIVSKSIGKDRLSKESFEEKEIDAIRSDFADNKLLHLRIPVDLRPKTDVYDNKGHIDLFMKATSGDEQQHSLFVRGPIVLHSERGYFSEPSAHGAMIASEENVSGFLGDAESPAHTEWDSRTKKLVEHWDSPRTELTSIRYALEDLYGIIEEQEKNEYKDMFSDYFSIMDEERGSSDNDSNNGEDDDVVVPESKKILSVTPISGGFVITAGTNIKNRDLEKEKIYVKIAYDMDEGNPFKHFDKYDFDLTQSNNLNVEITDGECETLKANEIVITPENSNFRLKIDGFDVHRDVVVKAELK